MAADEQGERTEEATQTRREDFRKRGQVAHTRELASAMFLLGGALAVFTLSRFFFQEFLELFQTTFGNKLVEAIRNGDVFPVLKITFNKLLRLLAPVLGLSLLVSFSSSVLQIGMLNVENALSFHLNKINPLEGLKRLFSLRNFVEGIKALLKLIFVGVIVYFLMRHELAKIPFLINFSIDQLITYLGDIIFKLFGGIGLITLIFALADYFFQRWDLEKRMMMTKQEVKEEHKSREGDPLIKARIRKTQRELSNRRMMEKVPQASVIVTNPTHIAVALKYDVELPAPQLIAKGADLIAEKIKDIARQNDIPIVENKPLARTIFKTMKLGQIIPKDLFVAVAEVLAYVYKLKKKGRK